MNWERIDKFFKVIIRIFSYITILILIGLIFFILKESLPFFKSISIKEIFTERWKSYSIHPTFGMKNFIFSTIYISVLSLIFALPFAIGGALFISCIVKEKMRNFLKFYIVILAGIPSIIYGFLGVITVVKFLEWCGKITGESVFSGAVVLSIMILPYLTNSCEEKMYILNKKYELSSKVLGTSKWHLIKEVILPASRNDIMVSIILALGRALGETMAVMMVIGNAPISPKIFGKAQTLSSLIALEMGGAEIGSLHYHALFVAGLILIILILFLHILIYFLKKW